MKLLKSLFANMRAALREQEQIAARFSRHLTPRARQMFEFAEDEAVRLNHNFIGTEHLLLGLLKLDQGVAANVLIHVLRRQGVELMQVRASVEHYIGPGPDVGIRKPIPFTPQLKRVLVTAHKEAQALNHTYVGTEHILLGLLSEKGGVAAHVLEKFGLSLPKTRREILKELDPNLEEGEQPLQT